MIAALDKGQFWSQIDWVLLDMDGTLLDKYFDDYFWEILVPQKYAEKYGISVKKAQKELLNYYRQEEGTLNWTDLDFWSQKFDLDIPALKEQIRHLISIHPYVEDFLQFLKKRKKKVALVTNAHYKSLELKMKKTRLSPYFDRIICAFDIGLPKEKVAFWLKLQKELGFNPQKTAFIDDSEPPLLAAQQAGIKYLFFKSQSSSQLPPKIPLNGFKAIQSFNELM